MFDVEFSHFPQENMCRRDSRRKKRILRWMCLLYDDPCIPSNRPGLLHADTDLAPERVVLPESCLCIIYIVDINFTASWVVARSVRHVAPDSCHSAAIKNGKFMTD